MKNIASVLIFTLSTSALAAPMIDAEGTYHAAPPPRFEGGGIVATVTPDWLIANEGWSYATPDRIAQEEAALEEQRAAAEAAATLPATFPTGIAVTNSAGHWVEFIPDGTNVVCETLAIQISQSPLTPEQRNQMRQDAVSAREAKRAEAAAAKKSGQLQRRIAALEAMLGVE